MGAKPTKEDLEYVASSVGRVRGLSKEDLAGCVASLSDMAHTGMNMSLPEIRINDQPPEMAVIPKDAVRVQSVQHQVKARLQRQMATSEEPSGNEDILKQLQLLDLLESQDDDTDWASMRRWLVWCLHNNLDDKEQEDEMDVKLAVPSKSSPGISCHSNTSRLLRRQNKVDMYGVDNRGALTSKKSSSLSLDSDKGSSGHSSFDSCASGSPGEG